MSQGASLAGIARFCIVGAAAEKILPQGLDSPATPACQLPSGLRIHNDQLPSSYRSLARTARVTNYPAARPVS
jgi:hypothetical protein